ncbi:MAG: hypothetical protein WD673_03285 [Alphaproteobacteria bacterium]
MTRAPAPAADLGVDDIREGDVFEIARAFTAADVDAFAALSGGRDMPS